MTNIFLLVALLLISKATEGINRGLRISAAFCSFYITRMRPCAGHAAQEKLTACKGKDVGWENFGLLGLLCIATTLTILGLRSKEQLDAIMHCDHLDYFRLKI